MGVAEFEVERISSLFLGFALVCCTISAQLKAQLSNIRSLDEYRSCSNSDRITKAQMSVLVHAYSFTAQPIAKALVEAHKRGVKIQVILDKSQKSERYTSATFLANAGIPTFIDAAHAIAHNKVMILDGNTVITGSYNFTKAAEEKNAENLLIVRSPELAKIYTSNLEMHLKHSARYEARY